MILRSRFLAIPIHRIVFACGFVAAVSVLAPRSAGAGLGDCGQPASAGATPVATDALFILGAAVGTQTCDLCVCDVGNDGATTATDALTTLAAAVGQPVVLNCASCEPVSCFESSVPICGGLCPEGLTCLVDPEGGDQCECLNACEASSAPTCGGSCESEDPESICTHVNIAPAGVGSIDTCECLPPDVAFCENAEGPACEGFCAVGQECVSDGDGGCMCSSFPAQPACGSAAAPECLGTCADTLEGPTICEFNGDESCACVPFQGDETCLLNEAPVCGGVCSFGRQCAVESGECGCVAECEISSAPACGGACDDPAASCVVTTISVGEQMKDFCECWEIED